MGLFHAPLVGTYFTVREASVFRGEGTTMRDQHTSGHQLLVSTERILGHATAVVVGFILTIVGLSLGVTMVLLPIGIPVGLAGVMIFMWGMFQRAPRTQT